MYRVQIRVDLRDRDNLRDKDKDHFPKVSFSRRFHCILFFFTERTGEMATVQDVLQFCTGLVEIPPMGLDNGITLEYLPEDCSLPSAAACFVVLRLPLLTSKEDFFNKMDIGVLNSIGHYGLS